MARSIDIQRRPVAHRLPLIALAVLAAVMAATPAALSGDRKERREAIEAARRGDYDVPTKHWREGPVRYLLSHDEDRAFRALKTREERTRFIQAFWARRDPDPSTPDNEYRTLFYDRVAAAVSRFTETTKPGWKTDRGKIFILMGPPDEQDLFGDRQLAPDVILWTYRDPPGGISVGVHVTARFVRDRSGEYRMTNNLKLFGDETSLSIGLQMQAMQVHSLPQERELLEAITRAPAPESTEPFRTHRDYFRLSDDQTFTVLTLGVQDSLLEGSEIGESAPSDLAPESNEGEGPRFKAVARLVPEDESTAPTYDLAGPTGLAPGEGDMERDPDGFLLYQGAAAVRPGNYTAYYGVIDRTTGQIHSFSDVVIVPAFRQGRLSVSEITLASHFDRLPDRPDRRYPAPFVLGNLRVVPRAADVYRSGEDFAFYYQVRGTTTDPIDGRPDIDLEYRFFVSETAGSGEEPKFEPLGNPIRLVHLHSPVQGYSLPLQEWRPASYRLRVEVKDNLTGDRSSNQVEFRVF